MIALSGNNYSALMAFSLPKCGAYNGMVQLEARLPVENII